MATPPEKVGEVPKELQEFGYLSFSQNQQALYQPEEGAREKFKRKFKENPFVPIGLGVTTIALTAGLWQLKTGDKVKSQKMMRLRVAAQGFTVLALLAGVTYNAYKVKAARKESQSVEN